MDLFQSCCRSMTSWDILKKFDHSNTETQINIKSHEYVWQESHKLASEKIRLFVKRQAQITNVHTPHANLKWHKPHCMRPGYLCPRRSKQSWKTTNKNSSTFERDNIRVRFKLSATNFCSALMHSAVWHFMGHYLSINLGWDSTLKQNLN